MQPRHRFMSAYEQKVDTPADKNYQYLLFACDPYETVAFKIPNQVGRWVGALASDPCYACCVFMYDLVIIHASAYFNCTKI